MSSQTYAHSTEALLRLLRTEKADIQRISPKGYPLTDGLDYCCVGLNLRTELTIQCKRMEKRL